MLLVVTAHNGLLFLMSWEVMSLASFFLVMFEGEKPGVREAGWTYLVTMHLGTALLLAMFALLSRKSGSLDFDALSAPGLTGVVFLLGLIGFGTKAGLMPLARLAPRSASGRSLVRLGRDERRDDQDGHLRAACGC